MRTGSPARENPLARDGERAGDREAEIAYLRAAVRRRAAQTSLRQVAIAVGANVGTIANFAERGVVPYGRTLNLLRAWELRTWAEGGEGVPVAVADRLVEAITVSLPENERAGACAVLVEVVAREFERHRVPPPAWVHVLRRGASGGEAALVGARSGIAAERCA
jgi:hypothetical protein